MKREVSDRIRQRMADLNIKSVDIVRKVGVSKSTVSMWINGTSKPNGQNLLNLAKLLEASPAWIVSGKDHDSTRMPDSNAESIGGFAPWDNTTELDDDEIELPYFMDVKLAAGNGSHEVLENNGPKLRFAKSTLRKAGVDANCAACVRVAGNSMEPVLPDGSVVGVDTADSMVTDGKMYAINHDGLLRIKLLYLKPGGGLRVRSYNFDEFPDETYSEEESKSIRVIGKVFWYSVLL